MGIEAWFLAEATHYKSIDPAITFGTLRLSWDSTRRAMTWNSDWPLRTTLTSAMGSLGRDTSSTRRQDTVNALDYAANLHAVPFKVHIRRAITANCRGVSQLTKPCGALVSSPSFPKPAWACPSAKLRFTSQLPHNPYTLPQRLRPYPYSPSLPARLLVLYTSAFSPCLV